MAEEESKTPMPTEEQLGDAFAKVAANPNLAAQAMGMVNMAYAFQFAQTAIPKSEVVELTKVNENLNRLHAAKALIISVSALPLATPKMMVLISYYAPEGI